MLLGLVSEAGLGAATHPAQPGRSATPQAAHAPSKPAWRPPLDPTPAPGALPSVAPHTPLNTAAISASAANVAPAGGGAGASQDALRRALHAAFACAPSNLQNLDDDARAACRKRLIEGAAAMGEAKVDTIPPEKRAYYDAVAKAYQDPTATAHLPGVGCALPFGIPKGWKPSHRNPPHSLKLGPLPCYVVPPKGFLTEEADIPPADEIPKN